MLYLCTYGQRRSLRVREVWNLLMRSKLDHVFPGKTAIKEEGRISVNKPRRQEPIITMKIYYNHNFLQD